MFIAAAGPASNFIMAALFGVPFRLLYAYASTRHFEANTTLDRMLFFLLFLCAWCVLINIILGLFNLIPIFPLDGEKIVIGLLPYQQANSYMKLRQYGPMLLIFLIFLGFQYGLLGSYFFLMGSPFAWLFSGQTMGGINEAWVRVFYALWYQ